MRKSQVIEKVAARCSITASESEKYLNTFIKLVYEVVGNGGEVNISGFGKFYLREMKPTIRRNPRTKQLITLPAYNKVKFQAGEAMKRVVKLKK